MIGVVGPTARHDEAREAIHRAGTDATTGRAPAVLESSPEAVVALGDAAVIDLVRAGVGVPVLPVEAGPGLPSLPMESLSSAVEGVLSGAVRTITHPVLEVAEAGSTVGQAAFDVTLVTAAPARISEYAVSTDRRLDRFRADGVVLATPAGSHGYARDAGGPRVEPGTDAGVVVPISAFSTVVDRWVVSLEHPVRLSVERDEGEVSILLDGRAEAALEAPGAVDLRVGASFDVVHAEADAREDRAGGELEKL